VKGSLILGTAGLDLEDETPALEGCLQVGRVAASRHFGNVKALVRVTCRKVVFRWWKVTMTSGLSLASKAKSKIWVWNYA
jgi:hypothetical protein